MENDQPTPSYDAKSGKRLTKQVDFGKRGGEGKRKHGTILRRAGFQSEEEYDELVKNIDKASLAPRGKATDSYNKRE